MNNIPEIQNSQQSLDRLAAQRQIYSDSKTVAVLQMILTVPVVAICLILANFCFDLKIYVAYGGILIVLLDILVLTHWIDSLREKGAKIQELFDCKVLNLKWYNLKVGQSPDRETIIKYSSKYYRKNSKEAKPLKDWYPVDIQELRMPLARLVCQKSNLYWDAELRKCYACAIVSIVGILVVCGILLGFLIDLTLEEWLMAIVVPLMPAILWGIRQYQAHQASASRQQRLKKYVDRLWDDTLGGKISDVQLEMESRNL